MQIVTPWILFLRIANLPFTTTYILHLHYPGRLSTGAGAR